MYLQLKTFDAIKDEKKINEYLKDHEETLAESAIHFDPSDRDWETDFL